VTPRGTNWFIGCGYLLFAAHDETPPSSVVGPASSPPASVPSPPDEPDEDPDDVEGFPLLEPEEPPLLLPFELPLDPEELFKLLGPLVEGLDVQCARTGAIVRAATAATSRKRRFDVIDEETPVRRGTAGTRRFGSTISNCQPSGPKTYLQRPGPRIAAGNERNG
jgi:hypothetical protein